MPLPPATDNEPMPHAAPLPRRIAVLGAGGFIGSHLVPALAARPDLEVEAVDVAWTKLEDFFGGEARSSDHARARARVTRTQADIRRPGVLEAVTERCDVVVSLTALCNPALYNTKPVEVIDASYTDLVPLVELCARRRRWLVHFSTCEVYGRLALDRDGRPTPSMHEADTGFFFGPVQAERWTYACAKQLLERLIWAHGRHGGLPFTIVRPFNVIGPRMDFLPGLDGEGIPRVLASFMHALLTGRPLHLVDGGRQRRSFVWIGDFVDAIVRLLDRPAQAQGQIFNLGAPENDLSVRGLAEALSRAYAAVVPDAPAARLEEVTAEAFYGPGYDDTEARIPDIGSAILRLDWRPQTTLAEMLPPIVADYVARYTPLLAAERLKVAT